MKDFFKKRWVFPAVYLLSAALLISGFIWYQVASVDTAKEADLEGNALIEEFEEEAAEVNSTIENIMLPVKNQNEAIVKTNFYDENASEKQQETALVVYNNTYHPNTGMDFAAKDGKSFDVTAALSGKVTQVREDSLLGNVVEIEHGNGVVTTYQSIQDIGLKAGDEVAQGDVIGKAGQSLFNEKAGIHVHFEVRKDGVALNPQEFFNKPVSAIEEVVNEEKEEATEQENQGAAEESKDAAEESEQESSKLEDQSNSQEDTNEEKSSS
ncbi:stage II sporulation protein Q [Bacillus ectoiniformans]|nr:stage II sporulation protein Q [Bacillus ectoiniformans]